MEESIKMGTCRQCGSWSVAGHNHKKLIGRDAFVQASTTWALTCPETDKWRKYVHGVANPRIRTVVEALKTRRRHPTPATAVKTADRLEFMIVKQQRRRHKGEHTATAAVTSSRRSRDSAGALAVTLQEIEIPASASERAAFCVVEPNYMLLPTLGISHHPTSPHRTSVPRTLYR